MGPAPGFNLVNKTRSLKPAGFLFEQADRSTTAKMAERILTSTGRKPGHPPPEVVTLDDQSPTVITLDDGVGLGRKSARVGEEVEEVEPCQTPVSSLPKHINTMEDDLRTKAVYSPQFLEELRNKYDRRRRETDRKVEEQKIKKKFYEDKKKKKKFLGEKKKKKKKKKKKS